MSTILTEEYTEAYISVHIECPNCKVIMTVSGKNERFIQCEFVGCKFYKVKYEQPKIMLKKVKNQVDK